MAGASDPASFRETKHQTPGDIDYRIRLQNYFVTSMGSTFDKLDHFAKYIPRQRLTNFISKYEIFKQILHIQGSVVECGVLFGGGLMTWAQLSAIFEPLNYQRAIVGFDTFSGFSGLSPEDKMGRSEFCNSGGLAIDSYEDLQQAIALYDANRFLSHIPKVKLVRGDATHTIPEFVQSNPHLVVSLLYLDFDLFEPTKVALEHLVPRMPKGAIIAFDELNCPDFPGETAAVLQTVGIRKLRVQRFAFDTLISFAVLE